MTARAVRRGGRTRRGFSMLDVLVGLALLALVFTVGIRFVLALGEAGEGAIRRGAERRAVELAAQALAGDFDTVTPCAGTGPEVRLVAINRLGTAPDDSVAFYRDAGSGSDGTARIALTAWRVTGGRLERAETVGPATACASLALPTGGWEAYLTGVRRIEGGPYFAPLRLGQAVSGYTSGPCTGVATSRCAFDALRVRLAAEPDPGAGPVPFDATYPLVRAGP